MTSPEPVPVLLVHGIWNTGRCFDRLRSALQQSGVHHVRAIDLEPNDGRAAIPDLARQISMQAQRLLEATGSSQLDVVGFSMGALVTRYWIQRGGGKGHVRRYISIAGPHQGTLNAWFLPLAGARDMRPGSALLKELASAGWGDVEVHCFITPYDLMIVPPRSGVLPQARSVRVFPVAMHRWLISDPRVLAAVTQALTL